MNPGTKRILTILAAILLLAPAPLSLAEAGAPPTDTAVQDNSAACPPLGEIKYYGDLRLYNGSVANTITCAIIVKILSYNEDSGTVDVEVTVRPLTLEEYRSYLLELYENIYPIPPRNVNMSIEEYKQYFINKTIYNDTYMAGVYGDYLEAIKQFNLAGKCNFTSVYRIDENNNVEGIGFFPLYSVFDPIPYRVEKINPVYMGKRLVSVGVGSKAIDDIDTGLAVVIEFADGNITKLYFKRNYLYLGHNVALLAGDGGVVYFSIVYPSPDAMWFLDNCVPDYSWEEFESPLESYLNYIVYAVVAVLALAVVYVVKRWF